MPSFMSSAMNFATVGAISQEDWEESWDQLIQILVKMRGELRKENPDAYMELLQLFERSSQFKVANLTVEQIQDHLVLAGAHFRNLLRKSGELPSWNCYDAHKKGEAIQWLSRRLSEQNREAIKAEYDGFDLIEALQALADHALVE